jgi:hypothetical protein
VQHRANHPAAYPYSQNPTLFVTLAVSPPLAGTASFTVRARSGSTTITAQSGVLLSGNGGRLNNIHVVRSVRRLDVHLPTSTPFLDAWCHLARALGARTG